MTLTIEKLLTRGKIPRQLRVDGRLVEQVAREQFAVECARQLGRSWPSQLRVARIRQLRVSVTISSGELTRDALARAWTASFVQELFAALARPNGTEIVRFESRADYLASVIRNLLSGTAPQQWAYQEFERSLNLGTAAAVFAVFDRDSSEIVPTLLILESWSLLDRLLAIWDAATLEGLFLAIERTNGLEDEKLTVEDLITVATLLLGRRSLLNGMDSPQGAGLGERKLALKLFLGLAREGDQKGSRTPSPLRIFRALGVLDTLLGCRKAVAAARKQFPLAAQPTVSKPDRAIQTSRTAFRELLELLGSIASTEVHQNLLDAFWNRLATETGAIPTSFADLLGELTAVFTSDIHRQQIAQLWNITGTGSSERRSVLAEFLAQLTSVVSSDSRRSQITQFWDIIAAGSNESRTAFATLFEELASAADSSDRQSIATKFNWISTECAGLFLLISTLERLGWGDRLRRLSFDAADGPRLMTYTFAGLGSAMLGRFDDAPASLDSGLTLFSGWVDAPDLSGLRRFFASEPAQTRRNLLRELLGNEVTEEETMDWAACFDSLANRLIREFASRIRGFARSSRSFIVKNFLALPGRIRIEETRLSIVMTSSPLNAVIHLSRLDDPIEEVSWLGGRRIEFEPYAQ